MTNDIICLRCGSVNDYRTVKSGPHLKAICNGCDRYIKFITQTKTIKTTIMAQGQGFYGSICLEDLFTGKLAKGSNGKTYVCIDNLNTAPFTKGKTNGKTYVSIGVWINEDIDQYGNIAGVSLSQSQQEREQQVKKIYIGNLRRSGQSAIKAAAAPVTQAASAIPAMNDLPF